MPDANSRRLDRCAVRTRSCPSLSFHEEPDRENTFQQKLSSFRHSWRSTIFAVWLALKYGWLGIMWFVNRPSERWKAWRTKREVAAKTVVPAIHADLPMVVRTKRVSRREAARKE